jgi:hypothetical protein
MSETRRLVRVVLSLVETLEATRQDAMLNQLVGMAVLEASECLVQEGFDADGLSDLGVSEEVAYLIAAKFRPSRDGPGSNGRSQGVPHLRLVGC